MKVADYIAAFLRAQEVGHVFELVGGMITHLLDAIHRRGGIELVSVHHEQAASFAADAYGRMTGRPGVAMATSGPGATNLLTGIGSCYFDSSPALFITGQVNRAEQKGDRAVRQLGFQETDIVAMAAPVTKGAWRVGSPEEVPGLLRRAYLLAVSGRPGPVLVDIPMDVQRAEIEVEPPARLPAGEGEGVPPATLEEVWERLARAERPLILAGGGVRAARAAGAFRAFAERAGVPVAHSLMGADVLPYGHPLRVGMIGSYGNRWANRAIARSDLLLVLGSRLDVRQTGSQVEAFGAGRAIVHVDCEEGEMNNRVTGCRAIRADLGAFLGSAHGGPHFGRSRAGRRHAGWLAEIEEERRRWPDTAELRDVPGINPNEFMHRLSAGSGASAYVADVGQHQMWAAQSLELGPEQRFLTSGGMGAMGFALPAAIGVCCARPGRPVVVIAGDGGFQLNLQELETVARNRLPIKMVVVNNRCHGMVRQFQESYFEGRYRSTLWGYTAPDFERVARAYGVAAGTVAEPGEVAGALGRLWADPGEPYLLQVMVDTYANAYPKLAFGRPISEMEPDATPLDMEGT